MRITKIDIKNFRAFHGKYQIDLDKTGQNLLVYGENGSGKSSLYKALQLFLESGEKNHPFKKHQNIFVKNNDGHIKLHLRANSRASERIYEWSKTITDETSDPQIIEASKAKGFLDYRNLLETHYVHREEDDVNIFKLLMDNLLRNTVNRLTNQPLGEEWTTLEELPRPRRNAKVRIAELKAQIETFNNGLASRLEELEAKTSEILSKFGYDVSLKFIFDHITYNCDEKTLDNQEILLKVEFFKENIDLHHLFLNEAKLSAIAIAIYLSSVLLQPESDLKILALDDVLIGLDMSNRLPVLDILAEEFSCYQIILTTYDKAWYEIVKQRTSQGGRPWKTVEFYFNKTDTYEVPVCTEDKPYLEKAKEGLETNDYKACAVYLRTAFEMIIEQFSEDKHLPVKYHRNPNQQNSQLFWDAIKIENKRRIKKQKPALLDQTLIDDIEQYRTRLLNELCHASFANIYKKRTSGCD